MRIAVVRNRKRDGVLYRCATPSPETYGRRTIQAVLDALREGGHTVACVEGDKTMLAELERFMPADAAGWPTGLVLNLAYGIQGECRYTHVAAMLEMAGVPYSGADPLGHAVSLDKVVTKSLLQNAGVPTPPSAVTSRADQPVVGLRFPLVVKPRHESTSFGVQLAYDHEGLAAAVSNVVREYRQEALVEQYIEGREICIGLLGNNPPALLPPVELDFGTRELRLLTWGDKFHRSLDEPEKVCPAALAAPALSELNALALATFRACHARDYARVDIRIDQSGRPYVLEINSMASLGQGGSFVRAAAAAGLDFTALVNAIVDIAWQRYSSMNGAGAERDRAAELPGADTARPLAISEPAMSQNRSRVLSRAHSEDA
jgi:D-alanine-D-alanine ligase